MMRLPPLFISHGAPSMALEPRQTGAMLQALGQRLPRPKAIVVVSPHWLTRVTTITSSPAPGTMHDFGGFDPALYDIQYPAPGAPALADRIVGLLEAAGWPVMENATRGLDHGAWTPLLFMYPDASIPVVQLSLNPQQSPERQYQLGRMLSPLLDEGVLILCSGSFTHNLHEFYGQEAELPPVLYVSEFRRWMLQQLAEGNLSELLSYRTQAPHAVRAHPTDEHLLPLFVAMGAATSHAMLPLSDEVLYGMLALDAFAFGEEIELLAPQMATVA